MPQYIHSQYVKQEAMDVYINRARLTVCEVGIFSTSLKYMPTPLFEEPMSIEITA